MQHECERQVTTRSAAKTMLCGSCAGPMWRSSTSLPEGAATCLPCRRKAKASKPLPLLHVPELVSCQICSRMFETTRPGHIYCSPDCRNSRRGFTNTTKAASAEERGYGKEHRETRAKWKPLVEAGQTNCCICGYWIEPGSKWHLDHTPERDGYRGVAHASCNVRDGASRGARRSNIARPVVEKHCPTCSSAFITTYPKQTYCSATCRPKVTAKPRVKQQRQCTDCGTTIKQGKRCTDCRAVANRAVARNQYRQRVGIPIDAPLWSRATA